MRILFPIAFVLECLQALFQWNLRMRFRCHERTEAASLVVVGSMFKSKLWFGDMFRCDSNVRARLNSSSCCRLIKLA
jgi:cytoskeletal protein CcmA (bactofilin family)